MSAFDIEASHVIFYGAGAYHHKVVMPTGNVYVACVPRNSIVAVTSTGFHVVLAESS